MIDIKSKTNPLIASLPEYLKKPESYKRVQKALLETLSCPKSHGDPLQMAECKRCTSNMLERRALMKRFGFQSPAQYMEWRKIHEIIEKRVRLPKYNT
jgi:7-cyano-7-deazaguanine synthase in queuosine biosynthesis